VSRRREITEELTGLFSGSRPIGDSVVPPLAFVAANAIWGLRPAAILAIGIAAVLVAWRLFRGRPLLYALGGVAGVLIAVVFAIRTGRAEGYFLPGIISGAAWTLVAIATVLARRPLAAWASWLFHGWPLAWYWRSDIRPAYSGVTWLWASYFAGRTLVQWVLYERGASGVLAVVRIFSGWPSLVLLLIAGYVFGLWRLQRLGGPSVEEFRAGVAPPFESQRRGF
jgi:hypothetical protein